MAVNANNLTTLNGLFKTVYGDRVQDVIPDGVILRNMIKFAPKDKILGNKYAQPVIVALEQGFSYGGTAGDAFALNDSVPGQVKESEIQGYEFVLRTQISYGAVSRSLGSEAAFENATKLVIANMVKSFAKRVEVMLWYGQSGLAEGTGSGAGQLALSGSVLTIPTAQWAPSIWSGGVNMRVEIYDETSATSLLVVPLTGVDLELRTITLGTPITGSLAAVTAAIGAGDDIRIYHQGARGNEFRGVNSIITGKTYGLAPLTTLFNISTTQYDLWKPVEYATGGGVLSFEKIQKAVARLVEKGLDTDVMVFVNPRTWANLLTEQAALRRYDQSYSMSKMENGSDALEFGSQNGRIRIQACGYVKEADAFIVDPGLCMRVGSTDITFRRPGRGDEFFRELENNAGYELRAYSDQALFTDSPARMAKLSGIVNS